MIGLASLGRAMDQAAFHDELHPLDNLDVGERIARDGDDVGETFRCFPEARFVHVLRDRRDDIESSRPYWGDRRFHTVRYEDQVLDPRPVLEKLMAFLGEAWDEAMLAHAGADSPFRDATRFAQNPEALAAVNTASLSCWQRDLDARDRRIFKRIAGQLLIELG